MKELPEFVEWGTPFVLMDTKLCSELETLTCSRVRLPIISLTRGWIGMRRFKPVLVSEPDNRLKFRLKSIWSHVKSRIYPWHMHRQKATRVISRRGEERQSSSTKNYLLLSVFTTMVSSSGQFLFNAWKALLSKVVSPSADSMLGFAKLFGYLLFCFAFIGKHNDLRPFTKTNWSFLASNIMFELRSLNAWKFYTIWPSAITSSVIGWVNLSQRYGKMNIIMINLIDTIH